VSCANEWLSSTATCKSLTNLKLLLTVWLWLVVGNGERVGCSTTRSPWDIEVCVLHYRACDIRLAGWRGNFDILYLPQSLAPVLFGIDANGCQCLKPNENRKLIPYPWFLSKK
jgi:hypothetical protein